MPDLSFEPTPDEPLFPEGDKLTITIPPAPGAEPGTPEFGGTFTCLDRANPPIEDDEVDPTTRPVSYLVETFRLQIVEPQRNEFAEALLSAIRENRILTSKLIEFGKLIAKARADAEKRAVSRSIDRPTPGAPGSTH